MPDTVTDSSIVTPTKPFVHLHCHSHYSLLDGASHDGVANLGSRPTVEGGERALEVHLFGEFGPLYGRWMEVEFVERLRGERKFESLEALRAQIGRDVEAARARLIQP